ncbi:MAG: zinc-dependent alcohol dehydrogenase family protein [Thermoplasmata archaeon]|nr:zinc-dependent alcohol dehydrogenase family protein [Thermoplasmata archaeon]
MRAMILRHPRAPLEVESGRAVRALGPDDLSIRVLACGVCRTDVHEVDGDLIVPKLPIVPGHEIVGRVEALGAAVERWRVGDRLGVSWLASTCGVCDFCRSGRENLCDRGRFTGLDVDGGYAEVAVADGRFCFPLPPSIPDVAAAPLLCAGAIGYRALRFVSEGQRIGLYGFGAAAHIAVQVARHRGQEVFAFTRPGDRAGQEFALRMGASWAGGSDAAPPDLLDGAVIFAPVGELIPKALASTVKGGTVVAAGIHLSDVPSFPYRLLWDERVVRSVANLTRADAAEYLALAEQIPIRTTTTSFPLREANEALARLRSGQIEGAAVLVPESAGRA